MFNVYNIIENYYYDNSVYCSVIIYDNFHIKNINELIKILKFEEFPIYILDNVKKIISKNIMMNTRMWIISQNLFDEWVYNNNFNLETLSVIFCLGSQSFNLVENIINSKLAKLHQNLQFYNIL